MTDAIARPLAALMAALHPEPGEAWAPVVGYEGLYLISTLGRVYSVPRPSSRGGILSASRYVNRRPYLKVNLSREGVIRTAKVHNLVVEAFLGPRPDGMQVLHGNDVPGDNRLTNLRYGTQSDNMLDAVRNGTHPEARLTHCWRGHELTDDNIYRHRGKRYCRVCVSIRSRMRRAS